MQKKIIFTYQFEEDKNSIKKIVGLPTFKEFYQKVKKYYYNFFRYVNHVKLNSPPFNIRTKEKILMLKLRNNIRIC